MELKIIDAEGSNQRGTHYSEWIVGSNQPGMGIEPVPVTFTHNNRQAHGTLELAFWGADGGKKTYGQVSYGPHRDCLNTGFILRRR